MPPWLVSPLARWIAGVAASLALLGGVWIAGDVHGHHACEDAHTKALAAAQAKVTKADTHMAQDVVAPIKTANAVAQARIADHTSTLLKELPHALSVSDPRAADCYVPGPAVSLLNAATAAPGAEVPRPAGRPEQAPPDAALSDVLAVAIYNSGVAQGALEEDRAWREWYVKAKAAYDAAVAGRRPPFGG